MNQNPAGAPEVVSTDLPENPKRQYGPLIGIIIIVALLGLGGLYFWGMQLMRDDSDAQEILLQDDTDPITEDLRTQDESDEVDSIEADLEATSIENLDSGADTFEGELQVQ